MLDKLEKTYLEIVESNADAISKESKYRDILRDWRSGKKKGSLNEILSDNANKDGALEVAVLNFEGEPTFYFINQPSPDDFTLGIDPKKDELVVMTLNQMRELNNARKEEAESTALPSEDEEFIQAETVDTTMNESLANMLNKLKGLFEADLGFGSTMTDRAPNSDTLAARDEPKVATGRYNHLAALAGQYDKFFGDNAFNTEGTKTDFIAQLLFFQSYAEIYKSKGGKLPVNKAPQQPQQAQQPKAPDLNPIGEAADPNWKAPEGYVPPKPTTGAESALTTYLLYVPFANEFSKGKAALMDDQGLEQQYDFALKSFTQNNMANTVMNEVKAAVEPIYNEIHLKNPALSEQINYIGNLLLSGKFDVRNAGTNYAACSKVYADAKENVDISLFDGINKAMGMMNNFFQRIKGVRSRSRATGPQNLTGVERTGVLPGAPEVSTAAKVTPVAPDELANLLRAYFTVDNRDVKNADHKDIGKTYEDSKNAVLQDFEKVPFAKADFQSSFPSSFDLGKSLGEFIRKQQSIFYAFFDAQEAENDPVLKSIHDDMKARMLNNHKETYIDEWLKPHMPTLHHTLEGIIPFGFLSDTNKEFVEDFTSAVKALLVVVYRTDIEIINLEDALADSSAEAVLDPAQRDAWTKRLGILNGIQEQLFGKILALAQESLQVVASSGKKSKNSAKAQEIISSGIDSAADLNRSSVRNVIAGIITEAIQIKLSETQNLGASVEGMVRKYTPDKMFNEYQRDNAGRMKNGQSPHISPRVAKTILTKILDDSTFHNLARADSGIENLPGNVVKNADTNGSASKYIETIANVAEGAIQEILYTIADSSEYSQEAHGILEEFNSLRDPQKGNVSFLPGKADEAIAKLIELVQLYIKVGSEIPGTSSIKHAVLKDLPVLIQRLEALINTPPEKRQNGAGKTNTTYSTNRQNAIRAVFGK